MFNTVAKQQKLSLKSTRSLLHGESKGKFAYRKKKRSNKKWKKK